MNRRISQSMVQELLHNPTSDIVQRKIILSALEYNPQNSDALYLMAKVEISGGDLKKGTEYLDEALRYNDWRLIYRNQAIILHVDTLLTRGQFQAIVDLYGAEDQWSAYLNDPDLLLLVAEGLYRNGDNAAPLVARAISRHPADLRFPALRILYEEIPVISDYSWLLKAHYDLAAPLPIPPGQQRRNEVGVLLPSMLYYLFTMEEGDSRSELLSLYNSWDQADVLAYILMLEDTPYTDRPVYLADLLAERTLNDYLLALAIRDDDFSRQGKEFFEDLIRSRNFVIDSDRDGLPEARAVYDEMQLEELAIYRDGSVEQIITFQSDRQGRVLPQSLRIQEEGGELTLFYDDYPYVYGAVFTREETDFREETSYFLRDMRFAHRIIDFPDPDESYSAREYLPGFLQGRGSLSEILIYSEPENSRGFFLTGNTALDRMLDELSPFIYLIERQYQPDSSGGLSEYQQSRFENQELLASRYDRDGDGEYELLHFFENDRIRYRIRLNDEQAVVLEYDAEGRVMAEDILSRTQSYRLPESVQAAIFAETWKIPE